MKLTHKLAISAVLLISAVPVLAGEPIPGVDVELGPTGGNVSVSTARGRVGKPPAGPSQEFEVGGGVRAGIASEEVGGGVRAGVAISNQGATDVNADASRMQNELRITNGVRAVTKKVTNDREKKMAPKGNTSVQSAVGIRTSTLPPGSPANISDQGSGGVLTSSRTTVEKGAVVPGPGPAGISENNSPLPADRPVAKVESKPGSAAVFDRWGNYSAKNAENKVASPGKDAERNPSQSSAAAMERYNARAAAGNAMAPNPLMNGPNAGLSVPVAPAMNPAMQGPLMGPGGAMGPGAMSPGAMGRQ